LDKRTDDLWHPGWLFAVVTIQFRRDVIGILRSLRIQLSGRRVPERSKNIAVFNSNC